MLTLFLLFLRLFLAPNCDVNKESARIISAIRADVEEIGKVTLQTFDTIDVFVGNAWKKF